MTYQNAQALTDGDIMVMRKAYADGMTLAQIAGVIGVSSRTVSELVSGKLRGDLPGAVAIRRKGRPRATGEISRAGYQQRARRQARIEAGQCTVCGQPVAPRSRSQCEHHLAQTRERTRLWLARQQARGKKRT